MEVAIRYSDFIEIGYYRSDIGQKISILLERASFQYKIFSRINELGKFSDQKHIKESRERFEILIVQSIKDINDSIDTYNEAAIVAFDSKAKKILITPVRTEIKRIFKHVKTDETGYDLVAPYIEKEFHGFLMKTVDTVFDDLISHKNDYSDSIKSFKIKSYPKEYQQDLFQCLDIYLMGYKSTAILVLGRTFEKVFTVWGLLLIEKGKLAKKKEDFSDMSLENMFGLFKSRKLITEREWHLLSKLRLDRNVGGHYISDKDALLRKVSEDEAEATIKLTMPLIKRMHKNIKKLES
jgi:hypothetical protein